ncbi:MAG TPA: ABC transporter permease [Burkholderiales bacterium]|nr:ABC transporter permease [Burkholderiales bacterium]
MKIPINYSLRNLWARKLTTFLTAGGMALVVFVYAAVLMLDAGLRAALVATGQPDNILVTRRSAGTEVQSSVDRTQAAVIETTPGIALGPDLQPMVSKETVVLITLPKHDTGVLTNITTRGIGPAGFALRPQIKITQGRLLRFGTAEIMVGSSIAARFDGAGVGERLRFGGRDWTVVGVFDAGGSAFDSEVWGDSEQLMQVFRRPNFSSVIARLNEVSEFDRVRAALENDPRTPVDVKSERVFYEEQSEQMSSFIRYLGIFLSVVFSIGAMIGAMITMYAAVSNRTAEIGTLRALGFRRKGILLAFLFEALALGVVGWIVGVVLASMMQLVHISTMNWQSFSELAFSFDLTFGIVVQSLIFALVMGFIGGLLPAWRASRLQIVDALRAA